MPPWGAGPKPKKTPANTVRNSTYSTGNRFGGPPGTRTPGGPPGSGRASQISRPALAATVTAANRGYVSPAAVNRRATTQPSNTADRNMMNQARRAGPMDRGSVAQPNTPQASPYGAADRNMIAQANRAGAGSYDRTVFSPQELMQAATSGAATAPAANAVQVQRGAADRNMIAQAQRAGSMDRGSVAQPNTPQASPYAGLDLTSRANSNARMVLPSADEQRAAIAAGGTAYNPAQTARIADIRNNATAAYQGPGPSANMLAQGSQGAREQEIYNWLGTEGAQNLLAQNAAAAAPAWDPANNDAPITGAVGMWTDPTNGGQMPDPADADAWQAMQDAVDKEFGPNQSIYNPEYDTERFPTYDPSNTVAPFAPSGWDDGYGTTGSGPDAGLGTFDPFTGEYLQFGSELSGIENQRGMIDEADEFWDLAHQRKWDEANRGIPGIFNSRGMLDSGGFGRAKALSLSDQNYEQDVQDWQVLNQKAALDAQQKAAEQGLTAARSGAVFDPWTSGYRVGR